MLTCDTQSTRERPMSLRLKVYFQNGQKYETKAKFQIAQLRNQRPLTTKTL